MSEDVSDVYEKAAIDLRGLQGIIRHYVISCATKTWNIMRIWFTQSVRIFKKAWPSMNYTTLCRMMVNENLEDFMNMIQTVRYSKKRGRQYIMRHYSMWLPKLRLIYALMCSNNDNTRWWKAKWEYEIKTRTMKMSF